MTGASCVIKAIWCIYNVNKYVTKFLVLYVFMSGHTIQAMRMAVSHDLVTGRLGKRMKRGQHWKSKSNVCHLKICFIVDLQWCYSNIQCLQGGDFGWQEEKNVPSTPPKKQAHSTVLLKFSFQAKKLS